MCLFGRLVLFIGPWRAEPSTRQLKSLGRGLSVEVFSNYLRIVRRRALPRVYRVCGPGRAKGKKCFFGRLVHRPLEG
ncbi:unnamed protein product [Ectocarpus sp. 6 AP-2014]